MRSFFLVVVGPIASYLAHLAKRFEGVGIEHLVAVGPVETKAPPELSQAEIVAFWRTLVPRTVCQICATITFGETGNQRVTSGLRMRQASQVTVLAEKLN